MSLTLLISTKHHLWLGPNQSTWPNVVAHPLSDRFAVNRAYWSPIFDPDSPTVNNPVFRTVLETLSNPLIFSYSDSNNATHVDSLTAAHDFTFTWPNVVAHTIPDRTSRASTNAAANSSSYETAHTAAYGEANVSGYSTAHRTADSSAITTTDPNTYTASSSSTITTADPSTYAASSSSTITTTDPSTYGASSAGANETSIHSTNCFSNRISHANSKFWPISKAKFKSHASTI